MALEAGHDYVPILTSLLVGLGGLGVTLLASRSKIRGFKPG